MKFSICLLGRLSVRRDDEVLTGLEGRKVQELFAYLLLHRGRPHLREALATLLWPDAPSDQARRYLRQTLWQLQTALAPRQESSADTLLHTDPEWVEINADVDLWLDVEVVEGVYQRLHNPRSDPLDAGSLEAMREAVELYRGDLLEGCCLDWCLCERERLQQVTLALFDKLMCCSEARQEYEAGLYYGLQILRFDRASERTHRRMMRLHYLSGNRSAALQQYQRCEAVLSEELCVEPSRRTQELYRQIRADALAPPASPPAMLAGETSPADTAGILNHLVAALADLQRQVQQQSLDVGTLVHRFR